MMTAEFRNALSVGSRIDRYEIEAVIGHGGFGISYLAFDTASGQQVALKEYLPTELATREADDSVYPLSQSHLDNFQWGLERFLAEVRLLAQFDHSNIVRVERAFEGNGTAYMVMDFEKGESLAACLKRDGTLSNEALSAMLMPLLDGLELVHGAGFIHRDIKPSNIYLRLDGSPVLLDFGSARQALKGKTRTLTALVSAGYAPLEQYFSRSDLQGPWTDIYGLGATLYHAISGEPPIDAVERSRGVLGSTRDILPPVSEVASGEFPSCLLAAVDHALRIDDQERPRSIENWRRELTGEVSVPEARVTALVVPETRPVSARSREPPGIRATASRHLGLIAAILVVVIGSLGWWQWPATAERAVESRVSDAESRSLGQIAALRKALADAKAAGEVSRSRVAELTSRLRELEAARAATSSADATPAPVIGHDEARSSERDALVDMLKAALEAARAEADRAREQAGELAARLNMLEAVQNRDDADDAGRRREIDALLAAARLDVIQLRLTTPDGNNAHERFLRVLELDENNVEASLGLEGIVEKYIELANRARDEEDFDRAESYLNRASEVLPTFVPLAKAWAALEEGQSGRRTEMIRASEFETAANGSAVSQVAGNPSIAGERQPAGDRETGPTHSPAPLKTVIFPTSAAGWSQSTFVIVPDIVRQLTAFVKSEEKLTLSYSFYADPAKGQSVSPTYWNGLKAMREPDIPAIIAAARELEADVAIAVFHWNNSGTTNDVFRTRARVHLIDVASQIDYVEAGNGAKISDLARAALSKLDAARSAVLAGESATHLN